MPCLCMKYVPQVIHILIFPKLLSQEEELDVIVKSINS